MKQTLFLVFILISDTTLVVLALACKLHHSLKLKYIKPHTEGHEPQILVVLRCHINQANNHTGRKPKLFDR